MNLLHSIPQERTHFVFTPLKLADILLAAKWNKFGCEGMEEGMEEG